MSQLPTRYSPSCVWACKESRTEKTCRSRENRVPNTIRSTGIQPVPNPWLPLDGIRPVDSDGQRFNGTRRMTQPIGMFPTHVAECGSCSAVARGRQASLSARLLLVEPSHRESSTSLHPRSLQSPAPYDGSSVETPPTLLPAFLGLLRRPLLSPECGGYARSPAMRPLSSSSSRPFCPTATRLSPCIGPSQVRAFRWIFH